MSLRASSQLVMNVGVYRSLPFDVEKDLVQVGLIVKLPLVIAASSRLRPTLKEFVDAAPISRAATSTWWSTR